jgi:squalene/oxidosqualene cyclase-like protein
METTPTAPIVPKTVSRASLPRALAHLASLQHAGGEWEAEMVWNSMLLSQYVLTRRMVGAWPIPPETVRKIVKHYEVTRRPDGSWGMHGDSGGYVFMTSLAYVSLRLLGLAADHPLVAPARRWLRENGGTEAVPSWGKLWLAMVGLYGWEGVNPIPPELFLLPDSLPIHPNNFYCHTRYIYLGIAYLYGRRFTVELGALGEELKRELYTRPFGEIDFAKYRHEIADADLYVRPTRPLRAAWDALALYEKRPVQMLREKALAHCLSRIEYEVAASRRQGLSPVNGLLNCLALYDSNPRHPELAPSLAAIESWKWEDEVEGIRYCGAHSTSWDTAFALRALAEDRSEADAIRRGYLWLVSAQMQEELPGFAAERREPILGGWCFSNGVHRWAVSDCTAEALSAILGVHATGLIPPSEQISNERLLQAVRFILRRQNDDGGFGSYEKRRGSVMLEWINPSEMYGNCMTERSYTECTASCVGALARMIKSGLVAGALAEEVELAIARAVKLLRARQLADGSWAGFWGVNFTYAIFHVVEALRAAGARPDDPALQKAATWLLSKQKADGGWGEHWKSCLTDTYVEHPESQAAMTAWALMALLETLVPHNAAIARGVACLRQLQQSDGSWPQQAQSGIFFSTAMLDYRLYKDVFPAWTLARHARLIQS